ncbi:choice-of-anchor J domain-containing protein [Conexibacter sp. JD483]|uniref:choice-of-anchor J domain-containing protein n=1 Tax=unclassified Conexibacter TaxID=2627773 RepID=UPI00271ABB7A|nr:MULTISPECIES: choice-of-anchor J domain-containing protein [unclassified Conexibacter]MDO8188752.1 choice-of-anchor J domain-containing protein [Conexibacter sp. CPCC 205706]MDO8199904.1 choice-of-anchor J domain-containing protein [Conexibacter sp. CPCC 205762]MDR9371165.1 choice-of-anchor J domain-containing protein [Conexibacter sp. JD483]
MSRRLLALLVTACTAALLSLSGTAQADFEQGFETGPWFPGWESRNSSSPPSPSGWTMGAAGSPFDAADGSPDSYVVSDGSTVGSGGRLSHWLTSPDIILRGGDQIVFKLRGPGSPLKPDRVELRLARNGPGSLPGLDADGVGDYDLLLKTIASDDPDGFPTDWTTYSVTLSGRDLPSPMSGRFAFRHVAADTTTAGDLVAIDSVRYVEDRTPPAAPADAQIVTPSPGTSQNPTVRATLGEPGYVYFFNTASCSLLGGVKAVEAPDGGTISTEYPLSFDATKTFSVYATDYAGNASECVELGSYQHDGTAPVSLLDLPSGWHAAPVAARLTATDRDAYGTGDGSGVSAIHYTKGVAPATPTTASATYDAADPPLLGDGERIKWFAVDVVGNQEAVQVSDPAQVDTTAPLTSDAVPSGWVAVAPAARLTATDAQSGVATTYFTIGADPAPPTTASTVYNPDAPPTLNDGESIRYFSVDAVGNAATARRSAAARVDMTAPTSGDSVTGATLAGPVTLTAADAQSGVAATHYTTGVDPAEPTTASAVYDPANRPLLAAGERIRYFSVDAVGNAERARLSLAVPVPPLQQVDPPAPQPDPGVQQPPASPPASRGGTPTAAKPAVALARGDLKATRAGTVSLSVSCSGARCSGTLTIKVRRTTIASARYAIAAGKRATVSARLTAAGRRLLARARGGRLAVTVTVAGRSTARTLVRGR